MSKLIDVTYPFSPKLIEEVSKMEPKVLSGHFATHLDIMDRQFPLDYVKRRAVLFDVREFCESRPVDVGDVDWGLIEPDMMIVFYSGRSERYDYRSKEYHKQHPQLSQWLIDRLLENRISLIGIDFAGIRRGGEHALADQDCADRDVYVVENLVNLKEVPANIPFMAYTFPQAYIHTSGLPCRVVFEVEE
ncbi:MAG: cyclase family protein [Erysipelotrichaceae bacterium]|jgi:kynurenine formamidase|nr:cyclase family protein [Erysipelotrichaceae bacterium]